MNCKECNQEIANNIKPFAQYFCNRVCWIKNRNHLRLGMHCNKPAPMTVERQCNYCNIKFMTFKSRNIKYCSMNCYNKTKPGMKCSPEICAKISKIKKEQWASGKLSPPTWLHDKPYPPEFGQKISATKKAQHLHMTDECKKKLSKALKGKLVGDKNPMYGKHHTEETKKKIASKLMGEKNHFYGKHHSEESKQLMREAALKQFSTEEAKEEHRKVIKAATNRPEVRKKMSESAKKRILEGRVASTVSKTETALLDQLEALYNITIERQFKIENRFYDGKYKNILIECDGKYWHDKAKDVDNIKNKLAKKNGYRLVRIPIRNLDHLEESLNYSKSLFNTII